MTNKHTILENHRALCSGQQKKPQILIPKHNQCTEIQANKHYICISSGVVLLRYMFHNCLKSIYQYLDFIPVLLHSGHQSLNSQWHLLAQSTTIKQNIHYTRQQLIIQKVLNMHSFKA